MRSALPPFGRIARILPGLCLCFAVTAAALLLQRAETLAFGRSWIEALVIAILLGSVVRTFWAPDARWQSGIAFGAKTVLEIAVVLLGATISAGAVLAAGLPTIAAIVGLVGFGVAASYAIGRTMGLPHRIATLIACGNSICGSSAIAAVAPVIGADGDDVASSIAFTAVLGVVVVIALPIIAFALHMTPKGFGVFAGLTVYAVPQVLAATAPAGLIAAQIGTLVKLLRVLMLGPVIFFLSLFAVKDRDATTKPAIHQLVPWFIVGFLAMIAARSSHVIPDHALAPIGTVAGFLTIVSMAALGLGVDVRVIAKAGARVSTVVTLSLLVLGVTALSLIYSLKLG